MCARLLFRTLAVAGVTLLSMSSAHAAFTIWQVANVPLQSTNFTKSLTFNLFDPSLGTLTSVEFKLAGGVVGSIELESYDNAPSIVTSNLSAEIKIVRPDTTTVASVAPTVTKVDNLTAFDGVDDAGGTSGRTYLNLSDSLSTQQNSSSASDLALFTGPGTINLGVIATGTSNGTGPGNLRQDFLTSAEAEVQVRYSYNPIPEPAFYQASSLLLMGGLGFWRMRRKAQKSA